VFQYLIRNYSSFAAARTTFSVTGKFSNNFRNRIQQLLTYYVMNENFIVDQYLKYLFSYQLAVVDDMSILKYMACED